MKTFILSFVALCALIALSVSGEYTEQQARELYTSFLAKYEKTYASNDVEFNNRFNIFKNNLKLAEIAQKNDPGASYGITKFSDLTPQEFRNMYLMPKRTPEEMRGSLAGIAKPYTGINQKIYRDLPESFDWRDNGAVSPVKNQGMCGSCWAFSTVANLESVNFLKNKQMTEFSEQALVDCDHTCDPQDPKTCDSGCQGGLMNLAMTYVQKNGLPTESDYPYTARGGSCTYSNSSSAISISGFQMGPTDSNAIAQFLMDNGALSVAVNAEWLQMYVGGVSDPYMCNPKGLDHGVSIVGFSVGKNLFGSQIDTWIVKNSWGAHWGEKGYFRIRRGKDTCGIESFIVTALMA